MSFIGLRNTYTKHIRALKVEYKTVRVMREYLAIMFFIAPSPRHGETRGAWKTYERPQGRGILLVRTSAAQENGDLRVRGIL